MADLEKRVRDAKAAQFLLDEIATAEALGVDENELTQHLLRRAQQAGQKPDAFLQQAMEQNYIPEFIAEVRRGKALAHVVESATVKDAAGNTVELKNLQPDGTYADREEVQARAEAQAAEARARAALAATPPTDAAVDVITTSDYLTVDETDETGQTGEAMETGEPGDSLRSSPPAPLVGVRGDSGVVCSGPGDLPRTWRSPRSGCWPRSRFRPRLRLTR